MSIAVLVTITLILALTTFELIKLVVWLRTPIELRGHWWQRFERQLDAYVGLADPGPSADRADDSSPAAS